MNIPSTLVINYASAGKRLKAARALIGLSREQFEKKYGISAATLRTWESPTANRNGLTLKGADRIIASLKQEKIICTIEWLLYGKGEAPKSFQILEDTLIKPLSDLIDVPEMDYGQPIAIIKDVLSFQTNNPNAMTLIIQDDSMEPIYKLGEYVGGITANSINKLIGETCIIEMDDGISVLRRLEQSDKTGLYILISSYPKSQTSPSIMADVKINRAAKVIWHRKL